MPSHLSADSAQQTDHRIQDGTFMAVQLTERGIYHIRYLEGYPACVGREVSHFL